MTDQLYPTPETPAPLTDDDVFRVIHCIAQDAQARRRDPQAALDAIAALARLILARQP